ncbi:tRNA adenosine(34) deaminase TadA [Subtercola frigoramans]|uniref:tRNA-specific adenosine deaminase n=1 Tax=Subtercola frigoramans TaxID=120298 RepID=A0ABS2L1L4_9MICO|nr:tRNA adenosine(34) deaminase TadA [Subtercola frigoramans]MBM7470962.1 tRNA(adenine34) deaminase [Subtercola frigoramans]
MSETVFPASSQHDEWMLEALAEARLALRSGDVPVGAAIVVTESGERLATGRNERELHTDPTGHAEIVALRAAARARGNWQLQGTTLIVTLEPCVMCAGAILAARVDTVVFGAWDEKAGAVGSVYDVLRDRRLNHRVEVFAGVRAAECGQLLTEFFREP